MYLLGTTQIDKVIKDINIIEGKVYKLSAESEETKIATNTRLDKMDIDMVEAKSWMPYVKPKFYQYDFDFGNVFGKYEELSLKRSNLEKEISKVSSGLGYPIS